MLQLHPLSTSSSAYAVAPPAWEAFRRISREPCPFAAAHSAAHSSSGAHPPRVSPCFLPSPAGRQLLRLSATDSRPSVGRQPRFTQDLPTPQIPSAAHLSRTPSFQATDISSRHWPPPPAGGATGGLSHGGRWEVSRKSSSSGLCGHFTSIRDSIPMQLLAQRATYRAVGPWHCHCHSGHTHGAHVLQSQRFTPPSIPPLVAHSESLRDPGVRVPRLLPAPFMPPSAASPGVPIAPESWGPSVPGSTACSWERPPSTASLLPPARIALRFRISLGSTLPGSRPLVAALVSPPGVDANDLSLSQRPRCAAFHPSLSLTQP